MYRCEVCNAVSGDSKPRRLHIVRGAKNNIEREIPVCTACGDALDGGMSLQTLQRNVERVISPAKTRKMQQVRVSLPKALPAPVPNHQVVIGRLAKHLDQ